LLLQHFHNTMTVTEPVRRLILRYMDRKGHHEIFAAEAAEIFDCSLSSIWRIIRLRNQTGSYGQI
jgi:hypothetical protein